MLDTPVIDGTLMLSNTGPKTILGWETPGAPSMGLDINDT